MAGAIAFIIKIEIEKKNNNNICNCTDTLIGIYNGMQKGKGTRSFGLWGETSIRGAG